MVLEEGRGRILFDECIKTLEVIRPVPILENQ